MKKKWYKRIFAGILALALTATSFSGDIENLVRAEGGFADTYVTMESPNASYSFTNSSSQYYVPSSISFKLKNLNKEATSDVNCYIEAVNTSTGMKSSYTYSTYTIPKDADSEVFTLTGLNDLSLASGETLDISLKVTGVAQESNAIAIYQSSDGGYFPISYSMSDTDGATAYDVSVGEQSVTLLTGQSYNLIPKNTNTAFLNRPIKVETSSDKLSIVDNSDGSYTISPTSEAEGDATVTVTAANGKNKPITFTVGKTTITPDTLYYNGRNQASSISVTVNSAEQYVNWGGELVNAGTYEGVLDNGQKIQYTIQRKTISESNISDTNIKVNNITHAVEGTLDVTDVTPSISVNSGAGIDATVVLANPTDGGYNYTIRYTGTGNFDGTCTKTKFVPIDSGNVIDITDDLEVQFDSTGCVFTGNPVVPSDISVEYKGAALTQQPPLSDGRIPFASGAKVMVYIVCTNNINAGDAVLQVLGATENGYEASLEAEYYINPVNLASVTITKTPDLDKLPYNNGSDVTYSSIVVSSGGHEFVLDKDYTISYSSNTDIGPWASFTIMPKKGGNLQGSYRTVPFEIVGSLDNATVTVGGKANYTVNYSGKDTKSKATVKVTFPSSGQRLIEGTHYTLEYPADTVNAGVKTIKIIGKVGTDFEGQEREVTYEVKPINLPNTLKVQEKDRYYTGNPIRITNPATELSMAGLAQGIDYDVANLVYENNKNAGIATVTVQGLGNYIGTASATYPISKVTLTESNSTIEVVGGPFTYTGSQIKPDVKIKLNGVELNLSENFNLPTYTNNVNVGDLACVSVTANRANVEGTLSATFSIAAKSLSNCDITLGGKTVRKINDSEFECDFSAEYTGQSIPATLSIKDEGRIVDTKYYYKDTPYSRSTFVFREGDPDDMSTKSSNPKNPVVEKKNYFMVRGEGPYVGSNLKIYFTVQPRAISSSGINFEFDDDALATGHAELMFKSVTDTHPGKIARPETLEENKDYELVIPSDGYKAGTHTAIVKGIGDYTGEKEIEYTIGASLANLKVSLYPKDTSGEGEKYPEDASHVIQTDYLGATPAVKVFLAGVPVDKDNYTVEFSDTTNFNADGRIRTVTIKANPDSLAVYGETTVQYVIKKTDLATLQSQGVLQLVSDKDDKSDPSTNVVTVEYDGKAHLINDFKLNRLATRGGAVIGELKANIDVKYDQNQLGPGVQTITLKATAIDDTNYEGTATFTLKLVPKEIDGTRFTITAIPSSATYTGSDIEPIIKVVDKGTGKELTSSDFDVSYDNNTLPSTPANKAKFTVTGKGNYTGTYVGEFTIEQIDVADFDVIFDATEVPYEVLGDGKPKPQTPSYHVYYKGVELKKGVDYDAEFTNNTTPTTKASLLITAHDTNKYKGEKAPFYFTIVGDIEDASYVTYVDPTSKKTQQIKPSTKQADIVNTIGLEKNFLKFTYLDDAGVSQSRFLNAGTDVDYIVENFEITLGDNKTITLSAKPGGCWRGSRTITGFKFQGSLKDATILDSTPSRIVDYTGASIDHTDKINVYWGGELISPDEYEFAPSTLTGTDVGQYTYIVKPKTGSLLWGDTNTKQGDWFIYYNLDKMVLELQGDVYTTTDASGREVYESKYSGIDKSTTVIPKVKVSRDTSPVGGSSNFKVTFNPTNPINPQDNVLVNVSPADGDSYTRGSAQAKFNIVGIALERVEITGYKVGDDTITDPAKLVYTGEPVVPTVKVYATGVSDPIDESKYTLEYYDKNGNRVVTCVNANNTKDAADYYYVVAKGRGGYSGSTPADDSGCHFVINPYDLTKHWTLGSTPTKGDVYAIADPTVIYSGKQENPEDKGVEPTVVVNYQTTTTSAKELVLGKDYTIEYKNNFKVSDKSGIPADTSYPYFIIKAVEGGNYTGEVNKNFVINPATIKNITLDTNEAPYTGTSVEVKDVLKVYNDKNQLLEYGADKDYIIQVDPTPVKEKGTYNIKVVGKNNYTGDTTVDKDGNPLTFTITARRFEDTYIEIKIDGKDNSDSQKGYIVSSYVCQTFPETIPSISVRDTAIGTTIPSVDYEIVGWYNTDKSGDGSIHSETKSPYVEIKAKDGSQYEGTKKVYFSIGKDLREGYIDYTRVDYTYDGQVHKPTGIKVYDGVSATPVSAANGGYDINYPADMVNAGTKSISVTGKKNYFGTLSTDSSKNPIEYAINPRNIQVNRSKMQITLDLPQDADGNYYAYWTGSEIKPNVTVKDTELFSGRGYTLQQGLDKDYTVEYLYNTDITLDGYPLAQATIVPHNNYTDEGDVGVVKATFKIIPIEVNPGNIDIQWTDFTTGVGNDVVPWVDENTVVVPEYKVIYKADDGTATDLEKDIDYYLSFGYRNAAGDYVTSDDPGFKWYAGPMDLIATGAGNYHGEVKKTYAVRADLSEIDESVDIIGGDEALFTGDIPVLNNLQIKYASELPLLLPTSADEVSNNAHEVVWENENFRMTFTCPGGDYHYGHLELKSVGSRYYTGTFDFDFIAEGNVNDINVVDFVNEYDYTGAPVNVDYKLKTTGGTYVSNAISTVDYLDSSKNPIAAPIERGTYWARITIELDGNSKYEDHQFKIDAGDLDTARVEYTEEWTYTKSQIKPPIQVYDVNGHLLTEGTDYVVEYGTNIMPTTYPTPVENRTGIITIKGKEGSNYEGSEKTVKFAINLASPGVEHPVYGVRVTDETSDSVKLNWNRNAAVEKWVIEYTDNPGAGIVVPKKIEASNADNFKTITGLLADTPYQFEIYSMMGAVEGEHVIVNGSTTPEKMSNISVAPAGTNQVKITWTPVEGVSGYEIVRTDSPLNNYRLVVSLPSKNNPDSWINSNLYSGRTYYYKVRTYRVDSDRVVHYGGWSEPVQITVP